MKSTIIYFFNNVAIAFLTNLVCLLGLIACERTNNNSRGLITHDEVDVQFPTSLNVKI